MAKLNSQDVWLKKETTEQKNRCSGKHCTGPGSAATSGSECISSLGLLLPDQPEQACFLPQITTLCHFWAENVSCALLSPSTISPEKCCRDVPACARSAHAPHNLHCRAALCTISRSATWCPRVNPPLCVLRSRVEATGCRVGRRRAQSSAVQTVSRLSRCERRASVFTAPGRASSTAI